MSVFLDTVRRYDVAAIERSVASAVEALGVSLAGRRTALLKPNIVVGAPPKKGVVTHPAVVEAVVRVLRAAGLCDITLADGPGVGLDPAAVFEKSGYAALARRLGVRLVSLNEADRRERPWKYGTIGMPAIVEDADLYVNIPKLKTHGYTTLTLSIKNHKGLMTEADKKRAHHLGLHEPLVQHAKLSPPGLVVLDGIVAIEGDGPFHGALRRTGILAAGTSMLEVDAAVARLCGFDPRAIAHLRIAETEGLGTLDPALIGSAPSVHLKAANEQYGRLMNIYSWRDCTACSMCIDSFAAGVHLAAREPRYWLTLAPRLAFWGLLGRMHIVQGREARVPSARGRVVCLGQCTGALAAKEGLLHVPGCPPSGRDVAEALRKGL